MIAKNSSLEDKPCTVRPVFNGESEQGKEKSYHCQFKTKAPQITVYVNMLHTYTHIYASLHMKLQIRTLYTNRH